jgi:hypothetical protein
MGREAWGCGGRRTAMSEVKRGPDKSIRAKSRQFMADHEASEIFLPIPFV